MRSSRPPPSVPPSSRSAGARSGVDGLCDDLAKQRAFMGDVNPTYARLLAALEGVLCGGNASDVIVERLDRAWRERRFSAFYDRPLLLLASLRADAIATGSKHPLARAVAVDREPDASVITEPALLDALSPDRLALWLMIATRRVQTNEVSRAVTWRWPAALAGCDDGARPLALVDVGTSGGLNLVAHALPAEWVDASGASLPIVRRPRIVARTGFDTHPLDFHSAEDISWARACIWPGDESRIARFDSAVAALRSLDPSEAPLRVHRLNATLVPARLPEILRTIPGDAVLFITQTVVAAYMDDDKRDAYRRAMRSFVAASPPGRVAWLELELEPAGPNDPPAAITAHVPNGEGGTHDLVLARCGYHPQVIDIRAGASAFARAMRG